MQKVLVTGATGHIGTYICSRLGKRAQRYTQFREEPIASTTVIFDGGIPIFETSEERAVYWQTCDLKSCFTWQAA